MAVVEEFRVADLDWEAAAVAAGDVEGNFLGTMAGFAACTIPMCFASYRRKRFDVQVVCLMRMKSNKVAEFPAPPREMHACIK